MRRWSEVADGISGTTRTSEKLARLAEYLPTLTVEALPIAVTFLSGRPFPERDPRTPGTGWATIAAAVHHVANADPGALSAAYSRSSDVGQAVREVFEEADRGDLTSTASPTLEEVAAAYDALSAARGPAARSAILRDLLARCDPLTAKYVVRILSGELRIGLREGHLEASIARAFGRDLARVQWAGMLTGDIGHTAELARDDALARAELTMFRPLKSMLASPAADEHEVLRRLGSPVWVEDKYDGIRAQLHKLGAVVRLFSRDLHDVSSQFPEIIEGALAQPWDGILDGEVLAYREGVAMPFQRLQARLGRKDPSAEIREQVPVIFVAFDLLAHGQPGSDHTEPLLRSTLRERRAVLDTLGLASAPGFGVSNLLTAGDADGLAAVFSGARERGNEGLMVKDPDSTYSPGRRGHGWLKLKRPLATLDCVVVGVEVGHGKRHGVLSDYTFAVRDDRPGSTEGKLVTIGKAYSGLTDAELAEMTTWFSQHTRQHLGRYRVVDPMVVVEVAFDVIQHSDRHSSGFALRFPRIARLRLDKPAAEADTLHTVQAVYERLHEGAQYRVLTTPAGTP